MLFLVILECASMNDIFRVIFQISNLLHESLKVPQRLHVHLILLMILDLSVKTCYFLKHLNKTSLFLKVYFVLLVK